MTVVDTLNQEFSPELSPADRKFLEDNEPAPDASDDEWDDWYPKEAAVVWNPKRTAGAIYLTHQGCALRNLLVASGAHRGEIWFDGMADDPFDIKPVVRADGVAHDFYSWYLNWLEEAEKKFGIADGK